MQDYKKLDKALEYDQEAAEEYASAANEARALAARLEYLQGIIEENSELSKVVWTTLDGRTIALHKVEDKHLANIMRHLLNGGRPISREIAAEARKRELPIPTGSRMLMPEFEDMEEFDD